MTDIETIALYGPGNLKPQDLVAGFVAREKTLAYFLAELRHQTTPGASPRHHLIIGQRGMGKTTLLLRIAVAIGEAADSTRPHPNAVELAAEVGRNKPAPAGVSGNPTGLAPETVVARPYSGLQPILNSTALPPSGEATLVDYFVPLTFREEQYNVINLHVFWRNCIESLLDWLEQQGRDDEAKTLEQQLNEVENAYEQDRKAEAGGDAAGRVFRQACQRLQRRPVLFLDNLDLIIDALKKHDWGLRDSLQQSDGPLVIGAAPAYPKSLSDRKAAFFDFFRITTLERLETAEVRACLQRLAHRRGAAGTKVAAVLRRDPGRIDALTEMTGGNPRTLAVLYLLLESQAGEDAFADLEKLLDRMTPLYKARTEEAAPQARAVLDAVALNWDPITAKQVARDSGLDVTTVNAQLARLENDGYVEKVEVSGSGRSGYQIVERFFNIWYLMRHGSRRLKQRVQWLTGFLRGFYSPGDRETLARDVLRSGNHRGRADVMLALSESVDDPIYRKALSHAAGRDLLQQSEIRQRIECLVDLRDIDPEQADMVELERQALAVKREWPKGMEQGNRIKAKTPSFRQGMPESSARDGNLSDAQVIDLGNAVGHSLPSLDDRFRHPCRNDGVSDDVNCFMRLPWEVDARKFWELLGGSLEMSGAEKRKIIEQLPGMGLDELKGLIETLCKEIDELCESLNITEEELEAYRAAIRDGAIRHRYDLLGASAAALHENNTSIAAVGCLLGLKGDGDLDSVRDTCKRFVSDVNSIWLRIRDESDLQQPETAERVFDRGCWLDEHGFIYDAEIAYRQAIALEHQNADIWGNLGILLEVHMARYDEAETAYRKALILNENNAEIWYNLGDLLENHLARYDEAENAYRQAIRFDPENADYWSNLGWLLEFYLSNFTGAEVAYRRAIELDPHDVDLLNDFGVLLQYFLNRFQDAESVYHEVLKLDPNYTYAHGNLAFLYWLNLDRLDDANYHADLVVKTIAECGKLLLNAAKSLAMDLPKSTWNNLEIALSNSEDEIWKHYTACLYSILRYAFSRGYGLKFKEWMEAAGYPDRYAPLYWAFLALLEGEAILLNVNPEVRRTAERIYRGLTIGQKPEPDPPKRTRRQSTK